MGAGTSTQPQQSSKGVTDTSRSLQSSHSSSKPKAKVRGTARSNRLNSRDGSKKKTRSHPTSDESDVDDNLHELERTLNSLDLGALGNNLWEDGEYSANSLRVLRGGGGRERLSLSDGGEAREEILRDARSYSDGARFKKKIKMRTHRYSWEQKPRTKMNVNKKKEEDWQYQKPVIDGLDMEKFKSVNKKDPAPQVDKSDADETSTIEPPKLISEDRYTKNSFDRTPTYDFVEQNLLASIERETGFLD